MCVQVVWFSIFSGFPESVSVNQRVCDRGSGNTMATPWAQLRVSWHFNLSMCHDEIFHLIFCKWLDNYSEQCVSTPKKKEMVVGKQVWPQ